MAKKVTGSADLVGVEQIPVEELENHKLKQKNPVKEDEAHSAEEKKEIRLVVAMGITGRGKSTALNNIFGSDFHTGDGLESVTKQVQFHDTKTKENVIVIDTPGFAAEDLSEQEIKKDIVGHIGDLPIVLVYCCSIRGRYRKDAEEREVVKFIQKTLGKDIWKRAVLLLTHSDERRSKSGSPDEYKNYVHEYLKNFDSFLKRECGTSYVPECKAVFEEDIKLENLVAIPVGEKPDEEGFLVPNSNQSWNKIAYDEIIKRTCPIDVKTTERLATSSSVKSLMADVKEGKGCQLGLIIGGILGVIFGGLGIVPLAFFGAAIGIVADSMIEDSKTSQKMSKINKIRSESRKGVGSLIAETILNSFRRAHGQELSCRPPGYSGSGRSRHMVRSPESPLSDCSPPHTRSVSRQPSSSEHGSIEVSRNPEYPPDPEEPEPQAGSVE